LTDIRSLSIFGLSDVKVYFDFGTDYFRDRQEVLNRLQSITLPPERSADDLALVRDRRDFPI